jgi:predicted PurR-regulated permease PerM
MGAQFPPRNFSISMSIEQILHIMDTSDGNTEKIHAGPCFLNYKLHQELQEQQNKANENLLKEQRTFQTKNLGHSKSLVRGTWALVIGNWALVIVTIFLVLKKG